MKGGRVEEKTRPKKSRLKKGGRSGVKRLLQGHRSKRKRAETGGPIETGEPFSVSSEGKTSLLEDLS